MLDWKSVPLWIIERGHTPIASRISSLNMSKVRQHLPFSAESSAMIPCFLMYTCTDHWKSHAAENKQFYPTPRTCWHQRVTSNSGSMTGLQDWKLQIPNHSFGRSRHKKVPSMRGQRNFTRHLCDSTRLSEFSYFSCNFSGSYYEHEQSSLNISHNKFPLSHLLFFFMPFFMFSNSLSHIQEPFWCGLCHERHLQSGHCRDAQINERETV